MKTYDVITIGTATRDIFLLSKQFPVMRDHRGVEDFYVPIGAKLEVERVVEATGGGATNAAATFGLWKFRTAYLGSVGDDDGGKAVLADLRARHVDTRFVHVAKRQPTALSVIVSVPGHGRTVLTHRSGAHELTPRTIALNKVRASWLYLTSLGGNMQLLHWVIATARERGMRIAFNPGMREVEHATILPLLAHCDIVLMNLDEGRTALNAHSATLPQVAQRLGNKTGACVVVTDGARGAAAFQDGKTFHAGAHLIHNVAEWTGAGDAFGSGFLAGYIRKGTLAAGLQFGTANAESVIRSIGAKTGILHTPPSAKGLVPIAATKRHR